MHRFGHMVLAVVLSSGLGACSVYTDMTTSDFAQQDSGVILAATDEAMQAVQSMRVTGQVRSKGHQVFVDVTATRDDRCAGSVRVGQSSIEIRRVKDRAWVSGEAHALDQLRRTSLPAAAAQQLGSSWLATDDKEVLALCDLGSLLARFEVVDHGDGRRGKDRPEGRLPVTVGEESSIDGQTVVQLTATPGGQHEELVWVRTEAPHHVVRVESTDARSGAELALTELDRDVEVRAPTPQETFIS